ncbi:hypothetical protein C7960_1507 [Methanohalophilus euhalobius]|jgi:hypothetical protein|uniref:Holliday junction resolvase n=1 Tax=Methanohalophilus euhalobius TaxID=51203 RepID=A0A285F588_9EURY|nr:MULTISPECIES: hypothetical protein [Methanohalophilus]RSD35020.1 MAG: hypothetical protein CI953_458 [Methanohalophilus sp.]ODV50038.1 MAG: hypothetical protein A8273_697 [Methanohalophilus sp. 2-GBenrich]RSD35650.1 MAG: hypothetical protein CI952_917 [Methanohalophilus sp.]RXG34778.1 hypothetical protein CI957_372 [Methanohalophilus sp. WG1-DM]TCL12271.1 hypothetical protein C7960_1507 [Methanohalophilus euhalobius]
MTEFERKLVQSFNDYFENCNIKAIAHRIKQHRFTPQFLDVMVDSLNPDYYLGIECKSISTEKGANALYFSQHFTIDKNGAHQVIRISEYLRRSGRAGFLVVELRQGSGKSRQAYIIPWKDIEEKYESGELKYTIDEIKLYSKLERKGDAYHIEPEKWAKQNKWMQTGE